MGNRARSARSSGKAAPAKKAKKQKSDVKTPRRRVTVVDEVDLEEVRKRVLEALEHLGHQTFSSEPSGYNLRGWLKSLQTLLDDFEDKVGEEALSAEYREKRVEVVEKFSKPADTSKLDEELDATRKEEADIKEKIMQESERISSRLNAIGADKMAKSKELDEEKARLKSVQDERDSKSFFSKLIGRGGPSTEPFEAKVADLEKGLKMLEDEALDLQAVRKSLEGRTGEEGPRDYMWKGLEALANKLKELEDTKQVRAQLSQEREDATASLRNAISEIKFQLKKEEE